MVRLLLIVICTLALSDVTAQSRMDFVFFGHRYELDTSTRYQGAPTGTLLFPKQRGHQVQFVGVNHAEAQKNYYEDPNDPGHFIIEDVSHCTDTFTENLVVDTLRLSELQKDSGFFVIKNGTKYLITSFMVRCDSLPASQGGEAWIHSYSDVLSEQQYSRYYMANRMWYIFEHSKGSDKFFVTDLEYYDYTRNSTVRLELSLYVVL